ncbi:MAG: hypothetical protein ACPGVV_11540 [Croceimicrobium sp.]|nr:hypothetical protein [Bacteroidota bacterium]
MRKYLIWAVLPLFLACQNTSVNEEQTISFLVSGDMLFEGPNTLQGEGSLDLVTLAENVGCNMEDIKSVKVSAAKAGMESTQQSITESVLLQVVSNQNDLSTIGTLNPVPAEGPLNLNTAQDIDLLPYLKDEGMTWVLDLNLKEDHMDAMMAKGQVSLIVEYAESK